MMRISKKAKILAISLLLIVVLSLLVIFTNIGKEENTYINFMIEVHNKIVENYWDKIGDKKLLNLYGQGIQKLTGDTASINDLSDLKDELNKILENIDQDKKGDFSVTLSNLVLNTLPPQGISTLHSERVEKELREETLKNVDKSTNLYKEIEVTPDANEKEIASAILKKTSELKNIISDPSYTENEKLEAHKKLDKVERAQETLTSEATKKIYDTVGAETTVYGEFIAPDTLHFKIKRMSPTTATEFVDSMKKILSENQARNLILDLRGNIGGLEEVVQILLGFFIDPKVEAYAFYHQGEKTLGHVLDRGIKLNGFENMVILQDSLTQSTGELMLSALKKNKIGISVGTNSGGYGTLKNSYDLENTLTLGDEIYTKVFIANSLVVRYDGEFIQGQGVAPDVDITKPDWKKKLEKLVPNKNLVKITESLVED